MNQEHPSQTIYKRKKLPVVDSRLQTPFLLQSVFYTLAILTLLLVAFLIPDIVASQDYTQAPEIRGLSVDRLRSLHSWIWFALIALLSLFSVHSFRTFLRVIGPLYRFRQAIYRLRQLDLDFQVTTRRGDWLDIEVDQLNELIGTWSDRIETLQKDAGSVSRDLEICRSLKEADGREERLQLLQDDLNALEQALARFRVGERKRAGDTNPPS